MRRFSTLSRLLQNSKFAEFAFLQQESVPNHRAADLPSLHQFELTNSTPNDSSSASRLNTTAAMKLLMNAVRRKKYGDAEKLFERSPNLHQRTAALRLLIKMFCEQLDFTTAKALLLTCLSKVGQEGAARYITHVTYTSQSSSDIEEIAERVFKELEDVSPAFVATCLYGSRLLDDKEGFHRIWKLASQHWEPSLKSPTLRAKALSAILDENWSLARKLWRISDGLSSSDEGVPRLRIWYMALRYFLVECPKMDAVDQILSIMKEENLQFTPSFSCLVLRHLATAFPAMSALNWVQYAKDRGWPLDGTAAEIIIAYCRRGLHARFGKTLGHKVYSYAVQKLLEHNLLVGKHKIGEGPRFRHDIAAFQSAKSGAAVLELLQSMLKRGLRVPLDCFVQAFHKIAMLGTRDELRKIVCLLKSLNHPLHCAETDLSMIELYSREVRYDRFTCLRLLGEYLVQYPLVSHDLRQLTRMAVILLNCGSHEEAAAVVDSMRVEQQQNAKFSYVNHDSASLQILVATKHKMREPIVPFLRGVISDSPNIYFDLIFINKIRRVLLLGNEDLDILADLENANAETLKSTYVEIEEVAKQVATCT